MDASSSTPYRVMDPDPVSLRDIGSVTKRRNDSEVPPHEMEFLVGVATQSHQPQGVARGDVDEDAWTVVVVVVSLEAKSVAWYVLELAETVAAVTSHVDVVLGDLLWADDTPQLPTITVAVSTGRCLTLDERLRALAMARGAELTSASDGVFVERELKDQCIRRVLSPSALAVYETNQRTITAEAFETCVDLTYHLLDTNGEIFHDTRQEHAFRLSVETHATPLRSYLRLNQVAQRAWTRPPRVDATSSSIVSMLRPLCRTKQGKRRLHERLDKPEIDAALLHARHDQLSELITSLASADTVGPALVALLDCVADAEQNSRWFLSDRSRDNTKAPSLQEFHTFCQWAQRFGSLCGQFHRTAARAHMALVGSVYGAQLVTSASTISSGFADAARSRINEFVNEDIDTGSPGMGGLRARIAACEASMVVHRNQVANVLLLQPERVKIVFEDDDFASTKSPSVVFRVTRQDGHRVFKASANTNGYKITLVHSRRTTGVWFSTDKLDALSAQRRALQLDTARLEAQLAASLVDEYDSFARRELCNCLYVAADLDVLSAFAQASIRHGFTRASVATDKPMLSIEGMRWPWDRVATNKLEQPASKRMRVETHLEDTAERVHLEERDVFLAIHSAVDNGGTILHRLAMTVLLNQMGCFVPCEKAGLPVFDSICLRTGSADHMMAHQSTFLAEMQQMSAILHRATPNSLVLVDELCRGTAPDEGLPIAVAICEHLMEKGVTTCLATRWNELVDTLVGMERVVVPTIGELRASSLDEIKRIYSTRVRACDARFITRLHDLDFPEQVIEGVKQALQASDIPLEK